MSDEPQAEEFPGHSTAFARVVYGWGIRRGDAKNRVDAVKGQISDVMLVRDDELVILRRMNVTDLAIEAEVARRNIAALNDFKQESAKASRRLEVLTWSLIAFTAGLGLLTVMLVLLTFVLVALTVALVVHDLTR